ARIEHAREGRNADRIPGHDSRRRADCPFEDRQPQSAVERRRHRHTARRARCQRDRVRHHEEMTRAFRTPKSDRAFAAASRILPGGVDSPVRAFKSVGASPVFITRGRGARIEDVDGHAYIDYVMSWGPLIHGHAPRGLLKALASAAARGTSFGAPTELET